MSEITVTFADGATLRLPAGVTAGDALSAQAERNGTSRKELKRALAVTVDNAGRLARPRRDAGTRRGLHRRRR